MIILGKQPNGELQAMEMDNELKIIQDYIGGYIQIQRIKDQIFAIFDEDGLMKKLDHNIFHYVGPVLFAGIEGEEFRGLTQKEIDEVFQLIKRYEEGWIQ